MGAKYLGEWKVPYDSSGQPKQTFKTDLKMKSGGSCLSNPFGL